MVSVRTVTPAGPSKSSECGIVPNASMKVTAAYAVIPMRRTPELIASARPLRVLSFIFDSSFLRQYSWFRTEAGSPKTTFGARRITLLAELCPCSTNAQSQTKWGHNFRWCLKLKECFSAVLCVPLRSLRLRLFQRRGRGGTQRTAEKKLKVRHYSIFRLFLQLLRLCRLALMRHRFY